MQVTRLVHHLEHRARAWLSRPGRIIRHGPLCERMECETCMYFSGIYDCLMAKEFTRPTDYCPCWLSRKGVMRDAIRRRKRVRSTTGNIQA